MRKAQVHPEGWVFSNGVNNKGSFRLFGGAHVYLGENASGQLVFTSRGARVMFTYNPATGLLSSKTAGDLTWCPGDNYLSFTAAAPAGCVSDFALAPFR